MAIPLYGVFPNWRYPFGDCYNKDDNILGSILRSPSFAKVPYGLLYELWSLLGPRANTDNHHIA